MLKIIRAIISNFDDIIKMEDFDLNNMLIDKKSLKSFIL